MRISSGISKRVFYFLLFSAVGAAPLAAQSFSFGVQAGTPVSDSFLANNPASSPANYSDKTPRYTVGPVFELHLPHSFSFEAAALYQQLHYEYYPFGFTTFRSVTTANSWDVPLLAKRYINVGIRPFVDGGVTLRYLSGSGTTLTNGSFTSTSAAADLSSNQNHGFTAGAGLDYQKGSIHFQPEIRYTRWQNINFQSADGLLSSNQNSIELLFGLTFGVRE
jgi:opacity protein-like surface antigen